jgi:excisionase family DNA binding protein
MIPTSQAAKLLKVNQSYIRRMAQEGRIPGAIKIGRDWIFPDKPKIVPSGNSGGNCP